MGRIAGPAVFVIMLLLDQWQTIMPDTAWRAAAVALWMAIWWATEAIPVAVTAFLPLVVFAPLGIADIKSAAAPYANPIIYLFLGGFILALGVETSGLHRRISLTILDKTGTDGRRLIAGFMAICASLSMWMSNTSTTIMLLPIVLSVITVLRENISDISERQHDDFRLALLLGLAYAASIGGLASLIGTPTNAFLAGYLVDNHGIEISFLRWMAVGIPITLVMLPCAWLMLSRVLFRVDIPANDAVAAHLHQMRLELGPMSPAEKRVAIMFLLVVFMWVTRRPLTDWLGLTALSDAGIAMFGAVMMFLIPSGNREKPKILTWDDTMRVPYGVLILMGGGFSLAAAVSESGLALWLGESLAPLNAFGISALIIASVALVIFLTELTSNVATTATMLPVMGAIAVTAGVSPVVLTVPVTIAATCAFMLPVATPPNAIVFSTGAITVPQMARAGFWLNVIAIFVVTAVSQMLVTQLI